MGGPVESSVGVGRDDLTAGERPQRVLRGGGEVDGALDEPDRAVASRALTPPGW